MISRLTKGVCAAPTVRIISGLAGSNLLALAVGVIGSLVQARYVGPDELGYFRSFAIATGCAVILQMGLDDALLRQFPYYIGRLQREKALAVAEITQAWDVIVSVAVGGAFCLIGTVMFCCGNWRAGLGWWAQAVAMVGFLYGSYLAAIYRSGHDFGKVAKGGVISSAVNLVVLPLFPLFSYVALALRSSLGSVLNLVYLHRHRPLRLQWRFNWKEWWQQVKEGIPIYSAGYGRTSGSTVAESTIILYFLGPAPLGLWSLSLMAMEAATKVPQAITMVYTPRLIEHYGRTHSVKDCFELCRVALVWGTIGMVILALLGCAAIPIVVRSLMPKYAAAIPTMWLMMATVPLIVLELPYSLLVAMGKVGQQNIAAYAGLGVFVLLALGAVKLGLGLTGVAGASLVGRGTRLAMTYLFLSRGSGPSRSPTEGASVQSVVQA